jgi:VIT1/CCC1 family predicted Fe2+/Mn2+ transporter
MGAVAYTSRLAERDHYVSELQRERSEIRECPEEERQEVREIYRAKGFDGPLLDAIVDRITANEETWLNVMMAEELRLEPVDPRDVLRTAVIVTLASFVGSLVPLLPFLIVPSPPAAWLSVVISAATLFGVGAYKAASLVGDWRRSGAQMVLIGLGAAWRALLSDECLGSPSDLDVDGLLGVHGSTVLYHGNAIAAQLTAATADPAGSVPVHQPRRACLGGR